MTTKPKAKKFRIRRSGSLAEPFEKTPPEQSSKAEPDASKPIASEPDTPKPAASEPDRSAQATSEQTASEDGFGSSAYPTADQRLADHEKSIEFKNEAIKNEGLTGRQLRMARRVALKNDLQPTSDFDAIRLLRQMGIDPFKRSTMLELVVPADDKNKSSNPSAGVPKTVDQNQLPSTELMTEDTRAREIYKIQQDISRRRRRRSLLLLTRLSVFVFLPTILVGIYYYSIATPLFATKSEFLIQQADSQSGGGLGGLFSGTGFATSQDSITVQSYLQSRDAMLRLDTDIGFKAHFEGENIDLLMRLETDGTNEAAYRLYKRLVKIGYDPTEGIIKMEVIAADPQVSAQFSLALIKYAELQVDNLTQRLREDQMQGSRESFQDSEVKMLTAQNRVLELQERLGVIDPASETSAIMGQISNFQIQLQEKTLQLQQLLDNTQPNQARVDGVEGDIKRLTALIAALRSQLTESGTESASLARISGELRMAEVDLQTRQAMMQQSLQQLETARIEANRQVRYLSLGVSPTAPDEATYPRKFEKTLVAFLIFSGIYMMASLTASVLREQVSS